MRIDWIEAHAFGPLEGKRLDLGPGVNIVWGRNEAGKSSWHAAIYAALCGMRRGPGRAGEDREFAERHRPWAAEEWRTSLYLTLASGRCIEIQQDLDGRVDCRAIEHPTGRDVSNEITFEGAPDGATWLGLNRRTFIHVACVRQAGVRQYASTREHCRASSSRSPPARPPAPPPRMPSGGSRRSARSRLAHCGRPRDRCAWP